MQENDHSPSSPPSVPSLATSPGGGPKPFIIIGILVVLIGLGIWGAGLMTEEKPEEADVLPEEVDEPKSKPKPKPRPKVETTSRPIKSEMAVLTDENREKFSENTGKWVSLEGTVKAGNEEGLIEFESPAGVTAQLVRGTAARLTGEYVKLIAWMISEEKAQVDGVFDITVVETGELLPEKDIYTKDDQVKLISLRHTKATFEGKVLEVRASEDDKSLYLVFEGDDFEFYGRGKVKSLKARKVTRKTLEKLVGKTVRLKGELIYEKTEEEKRLYIDFHDEDAYVIMD